MRPLVDWNRRRKEQNTNDRLARSPPVPVWIVDRKILRFLFEISPPPQKKNNNSMPGCLSVVFKTGEYNQLKKQW